MTRLLTLVALSLAMAFAPAFGEDKSGEEESERIHVTAEIVEQTFTGDLANPKVGDKLILRADIFDKNDKKVGIGAGACTVVSVPEEPEAEATEGDEDILLQCLNSVAFDQGQIIFGGLAPFPEVGVVARFGILGGTDKFREAEGEATLVVISPTLQEATFDLDD
jgi:hypothetical protein